MTIPPKSVDGIAYRMDGWEVVLTRFHYRSKSKGFQVMFFVRSQVSVIYIPFQLIAPQKKLIARVVDVRGLRCCWLMKIQFLC